MFEPFQRGDGGARGAGLGLAIARGFAEVERRARLGGGRRGRALRARAPDMSRILVVDDEPQILRALQTSLRGAGYDVDTAATGEQALTAAAVRPPDAVILDLVLPDRAAPRSAASSERGRTVPVIVLSVVGDESEKVAALDAGADDYVTKPFGVDELLARLRAALRRAEPRPSRCSRSATCGSISRRTR